MIAAVLLGPILAIQIQRYLEYIRDKKNRKLQLFHTLMATRTSRISMDHVQALNMIDIEFYDHGVFASQKNTAVREAWKIYNDHLNTNKTDTNYSIWNDKTDTLFVDLLHTMAKALGYDYDKVLLKRSGYAPMAHADYEDDNYEIRKGMVKLLSGDHPLPMYIVNLHPDPANQQVEK